MTRRKAQLPRSARPAIVGSMVVAALVLGVPGAAAFIQPQGRTFGATAGVEFSGVVASFLTDSPPPFSASISWGDGGQSQGTVACTNCPSQPQSYTVSGSHTYAQAGSYGVVVSISGSQQSATAQSTASVSASPKPVEPPTATFASQPPSPVTGQTLVFNGAGSSAQSGIVVRYEWTFGGGLPPTPCDGGAPIVHAVYDQPGTYQVTLKVTDSNGLTGSVTHQLQVADAGLSSAPGSAACGSATAGPPPGLRGRPSVKFTDPEELHYYDRAPAALPVSGQVKAPEGIAAFCVTGPKPMDTFPAACDQSGVVLKGKFTVLFPGLKPGYNFFDAWIRDKVGAVAHADLTVSVATATNGIDLRADTLEVTQAVQKLELPLKSPTDYAGVGLAADAKTVVRFFVDAPQTSKFPKRDAVADVEAALYGFRDGKLLAPAPLLSEEGAQEVTPGINVVYARAQPGYKPLYTFTLPASWTHGTIDLTAVVNPPDITPAITECKACYGNDDFTVRRIAFTPTVPFLLRSAKLTYKTPGFIFVPPADTVFAALRALEPLGDGQLQTPPYATMIDLGDVVSDPAAVKIALAELHSWAFWDYYYSSAPPDTYMGVQFGLIGGATVGDPVPFVRPGKRAFIFKLIGEGRSIRPLTSLAHEFGHILGRVHASKGCKGNENGQIGEDWPDAKGTIQGVGLDRRGLPYGLYPPAFFDLMSYCTDADETVSWTSTINWDRELAQFRTGKFFTARTPARSAAPGPTLRVSGYADAAGVHLVSVEPSVGPSSGGGASPYRLTVRNGAGAAVSTVALTVAGAHVDRDERQPGGVFGYIVGQAPAAGAAAVEVSRDGAVVARRAASAHAPTVRILEPRAGQVVGRGDKAAIRWRAGDRDGGALRIRVEYSRDGGHRWRPVFMGGNTGRAVLPSAYLAFSRHARIRVVVNDGFRAATAVSGTFRAVGAPPTVAISNPRERTRIAADAALYLSGTAYDDSGRALAGSRLRWLAGKRVLGSGRTLTVLGLPAGALRLRLEASDGLGRVGSASVAITVRGVKPRLIGLRVPPRVSRSARKVVLRVSSTVPALLRVGTLRARVDRRARRFAVPIRPGRTAVVLRLRLSASRKTSVVTVRIRR